MKPENQIKLADELFDKIAKWEFPADKFLNTYFRSNRFIGSKDRRVISEHIYGKIRGLGNCPEWMLKYFPKNSEAELEALSNDAPTDLRVNPMMAKKTEVMAELDAEAIAGTSYGIRLKKRQALKFDGRYEVQDAGSQMTVEYAEVKQGEKVLDYCSGAGGKTLHIVAEMRNRGRVVAHDIEKNKLIKLKNRADKAEVKIVKTGKPEGEFDLVVVDAPCSGTGTWRRSPDSKWRMNEKRLKYYVRLQREILETAREFVKDGGRLVYITCSVLPIENEEQVKWFLENDDRFSKAKDFLHLSPHKTNTDGFFAAMLVRE